MKETLRRSLAAVAVVAPLAVLGAAHATQSEQPTSTITKAEGARVLAVMFPGLPDSVLAAADDSARPYNPAIRDQQVISPRGGRLTINALAGSFSDSGSLTVTDVVMKSSRVIQGSSATASPTIVWQPNGTVKVTFPDSGTSNAVRLAELAVTAKDGIGQVAKATITVTDERPWSAVHAADVTINRSARTPATCVGAQEILPLDGSTIGWTGDRASIGSSGDYEVEIVTPSTAGTTAGGGWDGEDTLSRFHVDRVGIRYVPAASAQAGDTATFQFRFRNGSQISNIATATVINSAHVTCPR